MSTINSPVDDSSIYNSAVDTTLNGTDNDLSINSSINDVSSFKSDLDITNNTNTSVSLNESKETTSGSEKSKAKVKLFSEERSNEKSPASESEPSNDQYKQDIVIYDSIEAFDKNLPETVTLLRTEQGGKVYLVGTAHFSQKSQDDVSQVIRNVRPDVVMVELCHSRVHILRHDENTLLEEAKNINFTKIRNLINTNGMINGVFYILLLNMSAKITKELGMAPGGEFRRAVTEANKLQNCFVHLGDRPISITLQRALRGMSFWQTMKIIWKLLTFDDKITPEEVEQCKQKDLLEELMKEMAGEFPAFGDVFVKERDLYLCHSLQVAALPQNSNGHPTKVVGVVGIGHAKGIANNWGQVNQQQIEKILTIPPASLSNRIFKFTVKYGTLTIIGYGLFKFIRPRLQNIL